MRGIPTIKEDNITDLDIFDIYSIDVSVNSSLDNEKNSILMLEIFEIVSKMNKLFDEISCCDDIFGGKKVPWIADKFEYCLKNCTDKNKLVELKNLYDMYLKKTNIVIEGNLRLVVDLARKYKTNQIVCYEDIIQYGNIGLMRACEKYNPFCGCTFATYASKWIKQSINKSVRGVMSAYRVPYYYVYENSDRIDVYYSLFSELGREPTISEIANRMGKKVSEIEDMINVFTDAVSLDESIDLRFGDVELTRGDMIADPNADVFAKVSHDEAIKKLKDMLPECLTVRQKQVIENLIGLYGENYNQEDIAKLLGISEQRVSEIKKDAGKKLVRIPGLMDMLLD